MTTLNEQKNNSSKMLLWISMISMSMLFAGLISAIILRKAEGNWLDFDYPIWFYISTILILISSFTINSAKKYIKKDQLKIAEKYLKWTLILGLGFTLSQTLIWSSLFDSGVYFTGPGSNASGSFFYVLTLLHLLHLAAGIIALIITYKNLIFGLYSSQNLLGVELCAIFWHFLDILWIFLFLFLLYIH